MSDQGTGYQKKQAVINSYTKLAQSYKECSNAISAFVSHFNAVADPGEAAHWIATMNVVPPFGGAVAATSTAPAVSAEVDGTEGKKTRRKKEKRAKLEGEPTRPASAYIVFQNEMRPLLKEEFPDIKHQEILQKVSERWKNLDEATKKRYSEAATVALEQYKNDKTAFDQLHPELANTTAKKAPKKAKSADPEPAAVPVAESEDSEDSSDDSSEESEEDEDSDSDDEAVAKNLQPAAPPSKKSAKTAAPAAAPASKGKKAAAPAPEPAAAKRKEAPAAAAKEDKPKKKKNKA